MGQWRTDFLYGLRDVSPILLGILPFGMVAGAASINVGFTPTQVLALSIAFAGGAQLVMVELLTQDASIAVIIIAMTIINFRSSLYSASIAPHLESFSMKLKATLAYILSDQSFALSIVEFTSNPDRSRLWYYLGTSLPIWITWQIGGIAGIILGQRIPPDLGLDFIVTLVFIALLFPTLKDSPAIIAAVIGGGVALMGVGLPFNFGLLAGGFCGILAGTLTETEVTS